MAIFSKCLLAGFELFNEMYIAVASGLFGMLVLCKHGIENNQSIKILAVVSISAASLLYLSQEPVRYPPDKRKVIVITGCDSGLGFSLAQHTVESGFTVFAGFLSLESKGSREIRKKYGGSERLVQIQVDVTDNRSVEAAYKTVQHFLERHTKYSLYAIVNNAGVMVFGEFEWQTEKLIKHQIEVNLIGTFRFTKTFCPLLRQYKGRIITVTSHCSQANLPGLAVYGATKSALSSWSDGLRVELSKYGVDVITYIPGFFVLQSDIMSKHLQQAQEMHDHFTQEQHEFYSEYFKTYNVYLSYITAPPQPMKLEDKGTYEVFDGALLDKYPKVLYKNEDLRYGVYNLLFKYSPWLLRDWLVVRFMAMPQYTPPEEDEDEDQDEDEEEDEDYVQM